LGDVVRFIDELVARQGTTLAPASPAVPAVPHLHAQ
jgi:hypothetical protein